ncbi:MAG: peptidoglycan-binding protein [Clostridia bacterium]|nr:peptidoglycan-binding protein [Clostridia bacterium]
MKNEKPNRKAGRIALEVILSIAFFGACIAVWIAFRPTVLHAVFADAYPTPSPEGTAESAPIAVAYAAFEDNIAIVAPGTPIPTPEPTPTAEPTPSPVPTKNPAAGDTLLEGDRQPLVIDVSIRLMQLDYLDFEQPSDEFTEGTANAIRAFQLRNGLEVSGAVDPKTYAALYRDDALSYALVRGFSGDAVALVKERLIELGYLPETDTTDIYGEGTENAILDFCRRNGLPETSIVDNSLIESLFDENSVGRFYALGDTDEEIRTYQQRLLALGYLAGLPDGVFGKMTRAAVERFQSENGLVVDGNLGRTTMRLLESGDAVPFVFRKDVQGDDVEHIQLRLAKLNYLSSSQATGYFGDKTEAAVTAFQKQNKLPQSGEADAETIGALFASSAVAKPTPKPTKTPTPTPKVTATPKPTKTPKPTATPKPTSTPSGTDPTPKVTATPKPTKTPKPTATPKGTEEPSETEVPTVTETPNPTEPPAGDTGSSGSTIDYGDGVEAFIAIAESKLGCPYVSGAKGPDRFDCSGFVYWCLNQAGVKQSYMTSKGWTTCKKYLRITDRGDLRRGDVLVFSGTGNGKGHVGIYLGNGKMIDASSSAGKVRITDTVLTGSYWKEHFLMAYRIWG